ncbi:hypothetical protein [Microbacterium halotolerans]|uniref:hypothetical protein n=1 Tax=Microbacterium halotolerans TaxID=246613 RepID=UPI000E6AAE15|nr:hypothetical protein [Microbacterium halotolerans]
MKGEKIVVERKQTIGEDAHNVPIVDWVPETVENVLVAPGARADIPDVDRPAGTVVAWNLHFPKPYAKSLRGARIRVRGGKPCKVIGDPQPYTAENTPTEWWMPVEVDRADG